MYSQKSYIFSIFFRQRRYKFVSVFHLWLLFKKRIVYDMPNYLKRSYCTIKRPNKQLHNILFNCSFVYSIHISFWSLAMANQFLHFFHIIFPHFPIFCRFYVFLCTYINIFRFVHSVSCYHSHICCIGFTSSRVYTHPLILPLFHISRRSYLLHAFYPFFLSK